MSEEQQVVVALYKTVNSTEVREFETKEQAFQWRTEIAAANWDNEFPDDPEPEYCDIGCIYFYLMSNMTERAEYFQTFFTTMEGG
jgi:hypothetical protein